LRVADWMAARPSRVGWPVLRNATALGLSHWSLRRRITGLIDERRNLMTRVSIPVICVALAAFAGGAVLISCTTGVARGDNAPVQQGSASATQPSIALHKIAFENGDTEFANEGDTIIIEEVWCTAEKLGPAEICVVKGTATLASRDEAMIALFTTSSVQPSGPIDSRQMIPIKKGTQKFELRSVLVPGHPHVSFYPVKQGDGFGGVYFGQGEILLKNKGWSYKDAKGTSHTDSISSGK
jgi:hypothetical protein